MLTIPAICEQKESRHEIPCRLDYVNHIGRKIVLIDGPTLADLMIDHNIGVSKVREFILKKIDLDYFGEEEA